MRTSPSPFRASIFTAGVVATLSPAAIAAGVDVPLPAGAPWWLGWAIAAGGPVLTWAIYAVGRTVARAAAAALRAKGEQLRAKAKATPDTTDDAPAEVQARALEAAAAEIDRTIAGGGRE